VEKYLLSIGLIVAGLAAGQGLRRLVASGRVDKPERLGRWLRLMQKTAILGISPLVTLGAFWGVTLADARYAVLPFLGLGALVLGGVLGLLVSRLLRHGRPQAGSMFCAASFTNLGSFGGLISFLFFGEVGYVVVSLYRLLEELAYFLVGFPIAKRYGMWAEERGGHPLVKLLTDPYILVYFVCIAGGVALRFSGWTRPAFYPGLNAVLVPVVSLILVVTTGYNMKPGAIRGYWKECIAIGGIKFIATPVVVTGLAWLAGLGAVEGGAALRIVFVLAAMPPAFYSLIPPQLYGLDTDLANSCWLFNSGVFLALIPLLYIGQGLL
jgi:predicted permease